MYVLADPASTASSNCGCGWWCLRRLRDCIELATSTHLLTPYPLTVVGEPFGNLQDLKTHDYVKLLFGSLKAVRLQYIIYYWPFVARLRSLIVDPRAVQRRREYYNVRSRTSTGTFRSSTNNPFLSVGSYPNTEAGATGYATPRLHDRNPEA
jgi:hypothetical protein